MRELKADFRRDSVASLASTLIPETANYADYLRQDLRFAVVGFGKMGILHSSILNLFMPGCVRAVVDKSRLLSLAASRFIKTVKFYRDLRQMIERETPDVVYVTTPAQSHYSVVSELLEAGISNIFLEKPPTRNSHELDSLIAKMRSNQIVMVGFQKRYSLPFRHAKVLLSESVLGDVEEVGGYMRSNDILAPTMRYDSLGRGVLLDVGIHLIDLLVWMFGIDKVEEASCRRIYTHVDDSFKARLSSHDASVNLDVTWTSPEYRLPETSIQVRGSKGMLKVTEDYLSVSLTEKHRLLNDETHLVRHRPHYYQDVPPVNMADPEYTLENIHFLSSICSSADPLSSLKNASQVMRLVDELYRKAGM
jgi:predicted dehydrogenase